MNLRNVARKTGTFIMEKSPTILTAVGCAGVISTVIFAVRATPKAKLIVDQLNEEYAETKIPTGELVKSVVPLYVPTGLMACVTIGCIIGANRISTKRNAVLAGLYSASELAMKEYQEKVIEKIGEKKEREIKAELAADDIARHPVGNSEVIVTGKGQSLCYDSFSGRYFLSDYDQVRRVENIINHRINIEMWVTMNEVYYELGLSDIELGTHIGWNSDRMLEFDISSQVAEDGRPCLVIGYARRPVDRYGRSI